MEHGVHKFFVLFTNCCFIAEVCNMWMYDRWTLSLVRYLFIRFIRLNGCGSWWRNMEAKMKSVVWHHHRPKWVLQYSLCTLGDDVLNPNNSVNSITITVILNTNCARIYLSFDHMASAIMKKNAHLFVYFNLIANRILSLHSNN